MLLLLQAAVDVAQQAAPAVAQAAHEVAKVAQDNQDSWNAIGHQVTYGAGIVTVLQFLKKTKMFPWLSQSTDQANKTISVIFSAIVAIGIQFHITGGDMEHGWQFTGAIPSLDQLIDTFGRFMGQYMGQELMYQKLIKKPQEMTLVPPTQYDADGKPMEKKTE